jgi:RHS repeat-associated protein
MFAATSGYRSDGDAGLTHVGARYYDDQVGRFITRDTDLDEHPYIYCDHDPVNLVDPSGHGPKEWLKWIWDKLTGGGDKGGGGSGGGGGGGGTGGGGTGGGGTGGGGTGGGGTGGGGTGTGGTIIFKPTIVVKPVIVINPPGGGGGSGGGQHRGGKPRKHRTPKPKCGCGCSKCQCGG